eukprot:TRINITY_DN29456_c0_g1_i1.p1 TRINITY_DN29456_c0_g1~~TRINITY_DN29456_c0_g1_i1.p1  ORF type:complete len:763 (+),score=141.19 TRINITY_DN29456_c0_g1_i1:146-2434(+)
MGGSSSCEVSGVLAGIDSACSSKWWAGLVLGGKLYGIPCAAEQLLIYDPPSGKIKLVDTKHVATGEGKWRAAAAVGGKLYGLPDRADQLLVYDLNSGLASGVDTKKVSRGHLKWQAALTLGGKFYGIPHHANKLLVYDPNTRNVSGVDVSSIAIGNSKWLTGAAMGGKIYGLPCNADKLLIYDPVAGKASGVSIAHLAVGPLKWLAAVTLAGRLYAVPCNAEKLLIYDSIAGEATGVDTQSVAAGPGKWTTALVCNGRIYGIPDRADSILIFDPSTQNVSGVNIDHLAQCSGKWQSGTVIGSKIYAVPYHAEMVLVFDTVTGQATGVDTGGVWSGPSKWGMTATLNGKVCGLPFDAQQILLHEPSTEESMVLDTSDAKDAPGKADTEGENVIREVETAQSEIPDLKPEIGTELVQDFIAAWLSEWVYFTDVVAPSGVPQLRLAGEPLKFIVHKVLEDPLQGSPARVGLVTVLPTAAVYVVFKGSSVLNDFITNASVSPDYTPFDAAFGDRTTFIHHGAHHAVAQLRVQQWSELQEQLALAWKAGARQLVIAGHSLGGQYALAFMLQLFLDRSRGVEAKDDASKLLAEARCVAFGSPMCFGSAEGTDVRQDLADFLHERSVVYVNRGDPAARLWSELDLEDFMRYFVGWIHGKISGFSRRILDYACGEGGLAKRAEDLLQRPDIGKHLLRPAARYVHLSRMRLLADEPQPWRPLGGSSVSIEDHNLSQAYLPALSAAFDPAAAGSLFNEEGQSLVDETGHGKL